MTALTCFFAAAGLVFVLVWQQQNVTKRRYAWAIVTSLAIGAGQIFLWRVTPTAGPVEILATLLGGPFGVTASMYLHKRVVR